MLFRSVEEPKKEEPKPEEPAPIAPAEATPEVKPETPPDEPKEDDVKVVGHYLSELLGDRTSKSKDTPKDGLDIVGEIRRILN